MTRLLGRRSVMAMGAMGGLALAAGRTLAAPAAAPMAQVPPASGGLTLWTRIVDDRRATFRLTGSGSDSAQPLAAGALDMDRIGSVAQVQTAGRSFAIVAVARSWGVVPAACRMEGTTIRHPSSGRSVRVVSWTDFCYA
jgi:hypothetical protein